MEMLLAAMCAAVSWFVVKRFEPQDAAVALRLGELQGQGDSGAVGRPGWVQAGLTRLGRRFPSASAEALRSSLLAAGMSKTVPETIRGLQLCCAGAGLLSGLLAGPLAIIVCPLGAFLGHRLAPIYISRRAVRRREEVALALPDAVDLLAVCSHAGLNMALSLKRVAGRTNGVLGEELKQTLEEIELGAPRRVALRSLSERNSHRDLEALISVLENAERFGSQVSGSLETFSREVRDRRKRSAEEQARKAPVKILFPLIFFILPAFILLSVVPLLLSSFASLGL